MARREMKTSFPGLVRLLARNLYSEPNVFIRELIQNAHDATFLSGNTGRIDITINETANTITFADTGTGMSEREIEDYLSTIGVSGTGLKSKALTSETDGQDHQSYLEFNRTTIGQFGIGLLSAFVVAEQIDVFTRKRGEQAWKWTSRGGADYEIDQVDLHDLPLGTRVVVTVNKKYTSLIEVAEVRKAIKQYCDFLPYGIYLNGNGPINAIDAPWHRGKSAYVNAEDYNNQIRKFLNERYTDTPLHVIPIELSNPLAYGALYISNRRVPLLHTSGVVDIFQSRICVRTGDQELLPEWARFVSGIIDSPELQPTAARDNLIKNDKYYGLRRQLEDVILHDLQALRISDPARFRRICKFHHYHLKGMAIHNEHFFNSIIDLLPFETNHGEMDLSEYVARQPREVTGQVPIFFFSFGRDSNQFFDIADAHGFIAINTGAVFDEELIRKYAEKNPAMIILRQLDSYDDEAVFQSLGPTEKQVYAPLAASATTALGDLKINVKAQIRRFKPAALSGVILATERLDALERLRGYLETAAAADSAFDEIAQRTQQELKQQPLDFFLNADNPVVTRLANLGPLKLPNRQKMLLNLYNAAILNAQHQMTPENARIFYTQMHEQMISELNLEDRIAVAEEKLSACLNERRELQEALEKLKRGGVVEEGSSVVRNTIKFFVMMPYSDEYQPLENAIRDILEDEPYWFELHLPRDRTLEPEILTNIRHHASLADGYIAEISELNPNVMMELGWLFFEPTLKSRFQPDLLRPPLLMLWCEGEAKGRRPPANLEGSLRIERRSLHSAELETALRREFERMESIQRLVTHRKERFLSMHTLQKREFSPAHAKRICGRFNTIESLMSSDLSEVKDTSERRLIELARDKILDL